MSVTYVAHLLIETLMERNGDIINVHVSAYAPGKITDEQIKKWLSYSSKHQKREIAYNVCFDAYTYEELFGDKHE
jgi:hypothetical protein